jgi:hypothetical protein
MRSIFTLALVAMLIVGSSISTSALASAEYPECFAETPLPDIAKNPTPSTADMPKKFAKWIGVWGGGKWDDKRCTTLVVLTVNENGEAQVVYSWGAHSTRQSTPGFKHKKATISDDSEKMEFRYSEKYTVTFSFDTKDGKPILRSTFSGQTSSGYATLWPKE